MCCMKQAKRVEDVRQAGERYKEQVRDRIEKKMETYSENRTAQLNAITDRIKEHVSFLGVKNEKRKCSK